MTHPGKWPSTQSALLIRIRNLEDRESWELFVHMYAPLILRYSRRRGLQDADARDVTQEVFRSVSQSIGTFDYDRDLGLFRGWLGTITYRVISRHRRASDRAVAATGGDEFDMVMADLAGDQEAEWVEEFNAHILRTALDRIRSGFDESTWVAFEAVWRDGRQPQQVAEKLGRNTQWVYKAKFKVLGRLKEELLLLTDDTGFFSK